MFSPDGTLISASAAPHCGTFRETLIKRYTVERTSKAEIRLGEQSEKTENCWENSWNEIQFKGPLEKNRFKNRKKGVCKLGWFMLKHKP